MNFHCTRTEPNRLLLCICDIDAMYAKQMLDHGMAMKGSEQELLDLLHLIYPHWSAKYDEYGRIIVDERGLPNSYLNAYMYIQNFGLSLGIHYPFLGICIPRAWPAHLPRVSKQTNQSIIYIYIYLYNHGCMHAFFTRRDPDPNYSFPVTTTFLTLMFVEHYTSHRWLPVS